jgi:hypothetical protein
MGKNFSCNNVTGKRKKSDFYETPYSLTRLLLQNETIRGTVLEPACGNGAIVKVLNEYGISSIYYDKEKDFFTENRYFDWVVTNPPYSLAFEFIKKAKSCAENVALLLPLSYLHGKQRYDEVYSDTKFKLKKVYIFTRYPMLGEKLREDGKHNTGMMVYAWFIWSKKYTGEPILRWLDNDCYVIKNKGRIAFA